MKRFLILCLTIVITWTVAAQTKEITILAVNDMHASIDRFPQFAALVDSMRRIYPDLLLLSAGDNRTGNPVNDMHPQPSYPMTALMNRVGFNLSAVGNHEFDGKVAGFRDVVNQSVFRYVCANMQVHDSMRLHIEPYKIFDVGGVRVGILGLLQQGVNGLPDTHPANVENITFRSPLQTAGQYNWLRHQCDVFVLLSHDGYDESAELANQYPDADILISGHSHTRVEGTELHNNVLLTQSESHLKYVTHITVRLTDGEITHREACLLDVDDLPKDETIQAMVDDFNNNESLQRVLTQAINDFGCYEELGYLMADALRMEAGADIAFQNPGGVRIGSYPKGPVTVHTVYQLDPFGNEVIQFDLTGEEVLRLIEAAYYADNNDASYVSGIRYDMALDKQGKVKKVQVSMEDGSRFNPKRNYKVVMNSYLAAICQYEKTDSGQSLFRTAADYTIDYLEKQPAIDYQGVRRINVKR